MIKTISGDSLCKFITDMKCQTAKLLVSFLILTEEGRQISGAKISDVTNIGPKGRPLIHF